jgi:hypothetical protein
MRFVGAQHECVCVHQVRQLGAQLSERDGAGDAKSLA